MRVPPPTASRRVLSSVGFGRWRRCGRGSWPGFLPAGLREGVDVVGVATAAEGGVGGFSGGSWGGGEQDVIDGQATQGESVTRQERQGRGNDPEMN